MSLVIVKYSDLKQLMRRALDFEALHCAGVDSWEGFETVEFTSTQEAEEAVDELIRNAR